MDEDGCVHYLYILCSLNVNTMDFLLCDDDDDDVLPWSAGTEAKVSYHRPPLTALILSTTALDK